MANNINKKHGEKKRINMKSIFFALSFIFLIGFVQATDLSFSPSPQQVGVNEEFEINISVNDVIELYSYQFDLTYDSSILQYVNNFLLGPFLSSDGAGVFGLPPNSATLGLLDNYAATRYAVTNGVNGSGVIARLRFIAIGEGTSNLILSNDLLYDSDNINPQAIAHTTNVGVVNVQPSCTDADGDGYNTTIGGNCGSVVDCNDTNPDVNPGATEICNGVDDNCVGGIDEASPNCIGTTPYCVAGTCVACIDNADCSDGVSCTTDTCSLSLCSHVPVDSICDDSLFCDGVETCNIFAGCVPGTAPNINDGVPCTIDSCNEIIDSIVHTPDNSLCQNGLWCDGAETCNPLSGCQVGTSQICNDGVPCTVDSCSEGANVTDNLGSCIYDTSGCSCTIPGSAPIQCNDNNPCTDDICSASLTCQNVNNDTNTCNDSLFCTVNDRCSAGSCISNSINISDGVGCTTDSCNEITDQILHLPNDAVCNDDLWCNGLEVCNLLLDCQAGTLVDCSDSFSCTDDSCNEGTDSCDIHVNNNLNCLPGQVCDPLQFTPPTGCGIPVTCTDTDHDFYSLENGGNCCGPLNNALCNAGIDCNDTNADVNPGATEICNGVDDNCVGGIDEGCVAGECTITNLYWDMTNVNEDALVKLIVEGENCNGKQINFTILEYDGFADELVGDDPVINNPLPVVFGEGNATGVWVAEWQDDGFFGLGGDPEYYFVANVEGGISGASSTNIENMLKVTLTERKWEVLNIPLTAGKNSFSLPLILENMSLKDVFKNISSSTDKIYTYAGGFKIYYFDGVRPSNLELMETGRGYIVFMNEDAILTINGTKREEDLSRPSIHLNVGWNLIGTFSGTYKASEILRNVNYDPARLYMYNDISGAFESIGGETILESDKSYWIYVNEETNFVPLTGIVIGNE